MKIIIVGLGQVGQMLAEYAAAEGHEVVVIDRDGELVESVTDRFDVSGICGSGASRSVLMEAGADLADIVVALTPTDEVNIMICAVAKKCGACYTAARLYNNEFFEENAYLKNEFKIDAIVNPKWDTALEIAMQIGLPGTVKAEAFFGNDAVMLKVGIDRDSFLMGKPLSMIKPHFGVDMLVGIVIRDGKVHIPKGDFMLKEGDSIEIIVPSKHTSQVMMKLGMMRKPVKKVFLVGCGTTGRNLAEMLLKEKKQVIILEKDKKRCIELSTQLPTAEIACGDGIDDNVLLEEGIKFADVCVSITDSDEKNLVISLFAWYCGIKSIITKVDSPSIEHLLTKVSMDITVSPDVISVEKIKRFIKNITVYNDEGNDINRYYQIADGRAEAIEFIAYDNFAKKGIQLKSKDFTLKKGIVIAAIIRDGEMFIPDGSSDIRPGDHVIVIAAKDNNLNTINDIISR